MNKTPLGNVSPKQMLMVMFRTFSIGFIFTYVSPIHPRESRSEAYFHFCGSSLTKIEKKQYTSANTSI